MKRWLKTIIPLFALAFILLIPGIQAQAGTITSMTATAGTNEFTVSGVAGDGVLSVAVFVYDSTGGNLLQMESVAVDSSHAYTDTFAVADGTYVVKVADYEGGAFSETSVTVDSTVSAKYSVTATSDGNGRASASVTEAEAGTTVTLTAAPDSGYKFKSWTVESGGVTLADRASATTTFTMPAANVSVKAAFEKIASSDAANPSGDNPGASNDSNTSSQSTKDPKTGDESNLLLWILGMMGSSVVLAGMVITKLKK